MRERFKEGVITYAKSYYCVAGGDDQDLTTELRNVEAVGGNLDNSSIGRVVQPKPAQKGFKREWEKRN